MAQSAEKLNGVKSSKMCLVGFCKKARGKVLLSLALCFVMMVLMSRPLFYVVLAKGVAVSLRLLVRRSLGVLVLLMDALLDEAVVNLEGSLLPTQMIAQQAPPNAQPLELQRHDSFHALLMHVVFAMLGGFIGYRMPRQ